MALLEVSDLRKYFVVEKGIVRKNRNYVKAVDGVSFTLDKNQTLGIVGESGCGKTTLGKTVLRLLEPDSGVITLNVNGRSINVLDADEEEMRLVRKKMQMVFQDPQSSLNPRMPVKSIIGEPLKILKIAEDPEEREGIVLNLLTDVGLGKEHMERYPHEFSSGQRQRIGIARALAVGPDLIILDEPTSSVDVSVQAQVLNLLKRLQETWNMAYLFISHDLGVVYHMSDRIAVMYLGKIVEVADADRIFDNPLHPYTRALLSALPFPDPEFRGKKKRILLEGTVPDPINPPPGCRFHTRCFERKANRPCKREEPGMREVEKKHLVACHNY
ncbi:MAG TPA: ATP-binding cassette domain-containing protein [Candidatus Latescibacteria bacterium]|nr:ATP-binding cassette domain-containing protein [Candidatus Latescibacterota bacterium]